MKANTCPFELLRNAQKSEAVKQMRCKLQDYTPDDVPAHAIGRAMIRLNVLIYMKHHVYAFDSRDVVRVYQAISSTEPQ